MNEIKLQIGCLVFMIYIIIMYVKDTFNGNVKRNKYYNALIYVAPWTVILDGVTSWTVNHLIAVPRSDKIDKTKRKLFQSNESTLRSGESTECKKIIIKD